MRHHLTLTSMVVALAALAGCGSHASAPLMGASSSVSSSPVPATSGAAPQPYVSGNHLVDRRTGTTWAPRGIDWSSFEYACTQGWGYSALDTLGSDPVAASEKEAAAIASWGVDTVRVPLNEDCWLGTRGAPVSDATTARTADGYRQRVEDFVTALNERGIVVILDLQSRKRAGSPDFGNLAMPDADSLRFWTSVAGVYAVNPSIMFDAFNEPYSRYDASGREVFDLTWSCWRDGGCAVPAVDDQTAPDGHDYRAVGMTAVVAAIRSAGAHQPILLGGLDYANDLSQWLNYAPHDTQLVAAFHSYDFKPCQTSCWNDVVAPLAAKVPVLTSELGADKPLAGYVAAYLDWADEHGIGVLLWAWGNNPADPMALTQDITGTPTDYGRLAESWLARGRGGRATAQATPSATWLSTP